MSDSHDKPGALSAAPLSTRSPLGIDLGREPALQAPERPAGEARSCFSPRWLCASVFTALGGGALLAAALIVSLDGESLLGDDAEAPVTAARPSGSRSGQPVAARKGDKLVKPVEAVGARQSYRTPMTIRVGDREVIKVRAFVRVLTTLPTVAGPLASEVPTFNPLKLMAEGLQSPGALQFEPGSLEVADTEVSLVKGDIAVLVFEADAGPALSEEDVLAQINEERRAASESGRRPSLPIPPQLLLARTLRTPFGATEGELAFAPGPEAHFSTIEVRVVPENVTLLSKREPGARGPESGPEEKLAVVRKGEPIEALLRTNGATSEEVRTILGALTGSMRSFQVPEGRGVKLLMSGARAGSAPARPAILRVAITDGEKTEGIAALTDRGFYVPVAPAEPDAPRRARKAEADEEDDDEDEATAGLRLYESFYETALRQSVPRDVIDELVRVFSTDVDFQRRSTGEETFEVFFSEEEGELELLFAAITVGGETRRYYRFANPEDGVTDYYDEQGRSTKKSLIRKPLAEGEMRSRFGMRRHPILGYAKMHSGVDWGSRSGTPIVAAGNGTVQIAGWEGGYGRRVEIEHANGYLTTYSHMSGFARGVKEGSKVRQGQVIGYVGSTGLSTGPHLHYEVMIQGRFVDPMLIRVPRGRDLDGRAVTEFRRHRDQVDDLIRKAPGNARLAQGGG